jgi:hypothetical protein
MHTESTHAKLLPLVEEAHWLTTYHRGRLLLVKTPDQAHQAILQLIVQWILRGPFYLIAAGEWLPDHDELRTSVYRYTVHFDEVLDNLTLSRPFTCLQLLDLLIEADAQNKPVLILDFLHLFYDADVDLSLRDAALEQCCQYTKRLSVSNPIVLLVPDLNIEDYRRFFPLIASLADEIIEANKQPAVEASQGLLF